MALVGYDPTRQGEGQGRPRSRKPSLKHLEQTVMMTRMDLPHPKSRCALRLIPLVGGGLARTFVVREPETVLGRQMGADLRIWDGKVSRQHCKIFLSDQTATLVDLDSSNGTFINDEQIDRRVLADGDFIRIGDTVLRARYMDFAEQDSPDDTYWLSTRDPGTEMYNRQYILEALQREVARAARHNYPLTLLLVSFDAIGAPRDARLNVLDREMRSLGYLAQREGGEDLLVGRYSDAEMIIVSSMREPEEILELWARITGQQAEGADAGARPGMPFVLGVAAFPEQADSAEQLIEQAEGAVYQARKANAKPPLSKG